MTLQKNIISTCISYNKQPVYKQLY